jgi:hypothetical protein
MKAITLAAALAVVPAALHSTELETTHLFGFQLDHGGWPQSEVGHQPVEEASERSAGRLSQVGVNAGRGNAAVSEHHWATLVSTPFSSSRVAYPWRLCLQRHSRHYVSFRTMSGSSKAPSDSIGNVGSSRAQVLPITRHSFFPDT